MNTRRHERSKVICESFGLFVLLVFVVVVVIGLLTETKKKISSSRAGEGVMCFHSSVSTLIFIASVTHPENTSGGGSE